MKEKIKLTDGYETYLHKWNAKDEIAIMQLIHGSIENIERYENFIKFLNKNGISVWGIDLRGHGYAAMENNTLATFFDDKLENSTKPRDRVIIDINEISQKIKKDKKNLPYIIFGHSMGSFIVRKYANTYDDYDKVIAMGTVQMNNWVAIPALLLAWVIKTLRPKKEAKLLNNLSYKSYNKKIKNKETKCDWLSYNKDNVRAYLNSPLCSWGFDNRSFYEMLTWTKTISSKSNIKKHKDSAPILIIGGEDDPVGAYSKYLVAASNKYKKLGKKVELKIFKNMRHEILNEDKREDVYEAILKFINIK